jgi:hypothetical protein
MTVSAALTAVAALSDTKIIGNMLFFPDTTPRSLTSLWIITLSNKQSNAL